ncbi:MAG: O-antigen ligase family protein, partial [Pseudomonadota bacterium]|nr:O-antigen ligase family protein [Pseudomonadota bacterium]
MIPVLLPMLFDVGRALGAIIMVAYLLWGILSLRARDFHGVRALGMLYLLVLVTFSLGIFGSGHPQQGFAAYLVFAFSTLTLFFTLFCLRAGRFAGDLAFWFGLSALAALGVFAARLGYHGLQPGFIPATQVNSMNAAALFPLLYATFCSRFGSGRGGIVFLLLGLAAFPLFVFADSRTEVFMILMGAAAALGFYYRKLWVTLGLGLAAMPVVVATDIFLQGRDWVIARGWLAALDSLSSLRLSIWWVPFQYPPENPWVGVGMDNAQTYIRMASLPVKHMHNFVLEIWYETGWLGFAAFFVFCGLLLRH